MTTKQEQKFIEKQKEDTLAVCHVIGYSNINQGTIEAIVERVVKNTLEEVGRVVKIKHTREMQPNENRAKYLAFNRGEEHMRTKIQSLLAEMVHPLTHNSLEK